MTATIPFAKPVSQITLAPGSTIIIPNVSWQEFELILQELNARLGEIQNLEFRI